MKLRINEWEIEESGTVRATLALTAMGVASYALVNGIGQAEWLVGLMAAIAYYYFEKKVDTSVPETVDGDISFRVRK